jgi:hypothetical protein
MKVTYNELTMLVYNAIHSLKLELGDIDRITLMVIELELVGLNGVKNITDILENLTINDNLVEKIKSPKFHKNKISFNLQSISIIFYANILVYYLREKLLHKDYISCVIENTSDFLFAYNEYKIFAENGFFVKASWIDNNQNVCYEISPEDPQPTLYFSDNNSNKNTSNIELIISKNIIAKTKDNFTSYISCDALQKIKKDKLSKGIDISSNDWQRLKNIYAKGLVEDTEESRKGAGA